MRVGTPAEPHLQQVTCIMAEPVDLWVVGAEPTAQHVQRKGKAIHFREQGHDECGEHPEPAPVPAGQRLVEAPRKEDEKCRVDGGKEPQAIFTLSSMHVRVLLKMYRSFPSTKRHRACGYARDRMGGGFCRHHHVHRARHVH